MRLYLFLLVVAGFGALGGVLAYLTTSGRRPGVQLAEGPKEASWVNTSAAGALAAVLAWCLVAGHDILPLRSLIDLDSELTVKVALGAIGVGLSGSKWVGEHYQAKVFAFAGMVAAQDPANTALATAIASRDAKQIDEALKARPARSRS